MTRKPLLALALFSPVLVSLLLLAPRLLSPEFGLLDDAVTIQTARDVIRHPELCLRWGTETGRFLPAYWLYHTAVYALARDSPLVFFLANALLLALATALLIWFLRRRGADAFQAWLAGMLFALSGPVIENFYTLSKAEPLQVTAMLAALVLVTGAPGAGGFRRAAASAAVLCALCAKETSLVLVPISLCWLLAGLLPLPSGGDSMDRKKRRGVFAATLIATAAFFALRWIFVPLSIGSGSYTRGYQISLERILVSLSGWISWFVRDFPYLLVLLPFVAWTIRRRNQPQARLLCDALIWMAGWVAVFLPWQSALEYYLLPFAVGSAMFCGVAAGQLARQVQRGGAAWLRGLAAFGLILLAITQVNNFTSARFQLSVDYVNTALLDFLEGLPRDSRLLVNLPEPNEYQYEIGAHLAQLRGRNDLKVGYFRPEIPTPQDLRRPYYVATPVLKNQLAPTPRHAVHEGGAYHWERSLRAFGGKPIAVVHENIRRMPVLDFGLHRLVCPLVRGAGISCSEPRPFLEARGLSTGWRVYRLQPAAPPDLPALFLADGTWLFALPGGGAAQLRFGQAGDIPVCGDWDADGDTDIGVYRPSSLTWYLDHNLDGKPDREFRLQGMRPGDQPVTGDWDGDGSAGPGYFRPEDASWHFRNAFTERLEPDRGKGFTAESSRPAEKQELSGTQRQEGWLAARLGLPGDVPLAGDWDGDGRATVGIYRPSTGELALLDSLASQSAVTQINIGPGGTPVAADWAGNGRHSILLVRGSTWTPKLLCDCSPSNPPVSFQFGNGQGVPLAGKWGR